MNNIRNKTVIISSFPNNIAINKIIVFEKKKINFVLFKKVFFINK